MFSVKITKIWSFRGNATLGQTVTVPTNKNPWRTQDYLVYFTQVTCE